MYHCRNNVGYYRESGGVQKSVCHTLMLMVMVKRAALVESWFSWLRVTPTTGKDQPARIAMHDLRAETGSPQAQIGVSFW